jgi:hypothetical protein
MVLVSALAALFLAATPSVSSNEPQGLILFETEGVKTPPEGATAIDPGEKVVTLVIRSVRSLRGATLVHESPEGIAQRLATIQISGAAARVIDPYDGKSPATIDLGALAAGAPVTLEFAERYAEGSGGIVTFTVEAVTADGKIVREAYGQVVGTPGKTPVIHDDLIEFPAHEVPAEEKP